MGEFARGPRETWGRTLDAMRDLSQFWQSGAGLRMGTYWAGVLNDHHGAGSVTPQEFTNMERLKAEQGAAFWCAPDMLDVVEAAMGSLPNVELRNSDLPAPVGVLLLPRPVVVGDTNGKNIEVSLLMWAPYVYSDRDAALRVAPPEAKESNDGILLTTYTDLQALGEDDHRAELEAMRDNGYQRHLGSRYLFFSLDQWDFSDRWDATFNEWDFNDKNDGGGSRDAFPRAMDLRKFFAAFVLLSNQRVATHQRRTPDRATRRAFQRAVNTDLIPTVDVVTLRRAKLEDDGSEGPIIHDVEWSHRWLVTGHWRNQWYPKEGRHKPVWIAPYVKGPDDKPFVQKKRVYRLVR